MNRFAMTVLALGLFMGALACSKKSAELSPAQRKLVEGLVSKQPVRPQHPLDVKFGDGITLLGYDATAGKLEHGKNVSVTWYYKVDKAPGEGFQLFTHLADGRDVSRINIDRNGVLRELWQPERWEPGTYIRDPQTITVPSDWESDKVIVYLGFWKDDLRLEVKGPNDGNRRARVLELEVASKDEDLPELSALRANEELKLDGKLDEEVWKQAAATKELVNTMTGAPAEPKVTVKSAWDDEHLYFAFDVADDYLKSTFEQNDDHLWEQDCVEMMIDPDGDGKNYFELQVSPANKRFDTRYDSRRNPRPFGHMDFDSNLASGVDVRGKLNDEDADQGYTAEIAIPWAAFAAGEPKHAPAKLGETWRANFYVMDAREKRVRAVGFSPPRIGDFHVPNRFAKLTFSAPAESAAGTELAQDEKASDKAKPEKATQKKRPVRVEAAKKLPAEKPATATASE